MLTVSDEQFAAMAADKLHRVAASTAADWHAIYRQVAGHDARTSLEECHRIAFDSFWTWHDDDVDGEPGLLAEAVHAQLLSVEHGMPIEATLLAVRRFGRRLPAADAAMTLLLAELNV